MFKKILIASLALMVIATNVWAELSVSSLTRTTFGNKRVVMGYMTLTGNYSSTYTLNEELLGMKRIEEVIFSKRSESYFPYNLKWASGEVAVNVPTLTPYAIDGAAVAKADTFPVWMKAFTAVDADSSYVFVTLQGGRPIFGILAASIAPSTSATNGDPYFWNADSSYAMQIFGDTAMTWPSVRDRGILTNADTVFFDYNGTNRTTRLMYSGVGLGDQGDLYVPMSRGRFIKITKKTNSQITQAGAYPLYFVHATTVKRNKLRVDHGYAATTYSSFMPDTTFTSVPRIIPALGTNANTLVTITCWFMAIGS